mmetsp:Transcript_98706/g.212915  ORF Transcript_98706/g.212915 Transcript_98706/m.212915 type:complete len:199 (+) Transcript_98706:1064-1660(+)|eukprot:CAMPEP_0116968564 /NCGR_PEP_ID=MMETSP0467-20121206/51309_1 /TAXON_ID=283647 /ORGANISM="Mesodinium pulex, Strain SPMC105" /LENGTH=198 /DNA_ID=CAMNT_0004658863 /DNA_START=803 /DNA_END=1399 /DNA_ORIENTATION=-
MDAFTKLVIIPVFKAKKKGATTDNPDFFRNISLGETLYKLAESAFIHHKIDKIEDTSGAFQFGYKRKMGTEAAFKRLIEIINKRKKGIIVALDLKGAFDSPKRTELYKSIFENWGNAKFLHAYRRILEKMELILDLTGIALIKGVRSKVGVPQGMRSSAFSFLSCIGTVMKRVILETPNVDWVLYSDDITLIADNEED